MSSKRVLVYGGRGALGSACVSAFKARNWWVASVDIGSGDSASNEHSNANIFVDVSSSVVEQESRLLKDVKDVLGEEKLDAVICVAGGWAGGNASSKDFVKNADLMLKQSVHSSVLAAAVASNYLKSGGLLTLTGAAAALEATPTMIGYGLAKAAVHHLTKSLASPDGGLPTEAKVLAILPVTLDTPMNRKWMPKADTSTWTPLTFISDMFFKWANGENCPASGSLLKLITKDGVTEVTSA